MRTGIEFHAGQAHRSKHEGVRLLLILAPPAGSSNALGRATTLGVLGVVPNGQQRVLGDRGSHRRWESRYT